MRLPPLLVAIPLLAGCFQADQELPFALTGETTASRTIGPLGGTFSHPSGVAVTIPPGALTVPTEFTLAPAPDASFPGDAGRLVPGTAFDLSPRSVVLKKPARLALRLPSAGLPAGEQLRLGVARLEGGRADLVPSGSYDATSRLLTAELARLGPVAAVVADDAIPVGMGTPPALAGGSFASGPSGAAGPVGTGAAPSAAAASGTVHRFVAECRPEARRCFTSGLVQIWASPELLARLGGNLVIVAPRVVADLTFGAVGADGIPGEAVGSLTIQGTLRVQLGQAVSSYEIDESFRTGTGSSTPATTTVRIQGNRIILARTSDGNDRTMEYGLQLVGTGRLLTLRAEEEVELENDDGSVTTGSMILHVRLRG